MTPFLYAFGGTLLYAAVAGALLAAGHRLLAPLSRRAALLLLLLPLLFTGPALLTGRVYAPIDLPFMADPMKAIAAEHGIEGVHTGRSPTSGRR